MKKKPSLKVNLFFNFFLTLFNVAYPILTLPYISKVLKTSDIGNVNLANSILTWFILISNIGIPTYAVREIARVRNDKMQTTLLFWELMIIRIIVTFILLVAYIFIVFNTRLYNDLSLHMIFIIGLVFNIFSIDWLFESIENFRFITTRSIIIKLFSVLFTYLLVNNNNDYHIYGIILVSVAIINNVINMIYCIKTILVPIKLREINIYRHLSKLKLFMLSSSVFSFYSQFDTIILGFLGSKISVAFYTRAKQVLVLSLTLSSALSQVTIARSSYLFVENKDKFNNLINISIKIIFIISFPIVFIIINQSRNIMFVLGGKSFLSATLTLQILSICVLCMAISTLLTSQIMLASNNEFLNLRIHIVSAIICVALNLLLIPFWGHIGAAISLAVTYLIGSAYRIKVSKNIVMELVFFDKSVLNYLISSIGMFILITIINRLIILDEILALILSGIFGILVYLILLILLRDSFIRIQILGLLKGTLLKYKRNISIIKK